MTAVDTLLEQIATSLAALTPGLAPATLFRAHDDTSCTLDQVTEPDRFRRFEVVLDGPDDGEEWGESQNFSKVSVSIRVGYPLGAYEEIDGTSFKVANLKSRDFEQIDALMRPGALFAAYSDVQQVTLSSQREGKRVRETVYQIILKADLPRESYTAVSKAGEAKRRISDRIAGLTPALVAAVPFSALDGLGLGPETATQNRWRQFTVTLSQDPAAVARTSSTTTYHAIAVIEIGYPPGRTVDLGGTTFDIDEIRLSDTEQIDLLMRSDVFSSAPSFGPGAVTIAFGGAEDSDNVRRLRFDLELTRNWP